MNNTIYQILPLVHVLLNNRHGQDLDLAMALEALHRLVIREHWFRQLVHHDTGDSFPCTLLVVMVKLSKIVTIRQPILSFNTCACRLLVVKVLRNS